MTEISQFYELAQLIKNCSKHKKSLKDIIKYINNIFDDLPEIDLDNIDESTLQEFRNKLIWDDSDVKNGFILLVCCYYNNNEIYDIKKQIMIRSFKYYGVNEALIYYFEK